MTLNFILLSLTFWGWMWRIVGIISAVPILAPFKIFCAHIKPMAPLAEFLSQHNTHEEMRPVGSAVRPFGEVSLAGTYFIWSLPACRYPSGWQWSESGRACHNAQEYRMLK